MKKLKFISALALVMGLAACDNYELPNPPGQTYPEPDGYFENSGLVMDPVASTLNLTEANEANQFVTVATIKELIDFPASEGYVLEIDMQVGNDDAFSKSVVVNTVIDGDNVTVNPDILNGAIQSVMTKQPGTYDVPVRFAAYAALGSTRMRLGGVDATYCPETLNVVTLDPTKVMEQSYYLVPCDAAGNPDWSKAVAMLNTAGSGVSVYDNPEFALKFDVAEGASYYAKIASASAYEAKDASMLLGGNAAEGGMSGKLGEYGAFEIPVSGSVLLTVNVESDLYTVSYAFEVLYPFSGSVKVENLMCLYTDNYINYTGVTAINQQWDIYTTPDKTGVRYYQSDATEAVVSEDGLSQSGDIATSGTRLRAPYKGNSLYWVDVNLVLQTYSLTAIREIAVIGDGNGWDTATAVQLTPSKDFRTWTAEGVVIGSEFKLCCNGGWDINFGAGTDNGGGSYTIVMNGGNLPSTPGTYNVTVDFSSKPYTLTIQ